MRLHTWLIGALLPLAPALPLLPAAPGPKGPAPVSWKRTVVDRVFRSEGVAVADVNRDGKPDILTGEAWYEAPGWKMHEIRRLGSYDPLHGYSLSFLCFADDLNGDGYPDLIVVGFPG